MGSIILHNFPQRLLIYLKLVDLIKAVKMHIKQDAVEAELLWNVLQTFSNKGQLGNSSLNQAKQDNKLAMTELFLDASDDVPYVDRELAFKILKTISKNALSMLIRMWIEVLPKNLSKIEEILNADSYSLQPLDEEGQVELIVSYWVKKTSRDKLELIEYAKDLRAKYDLGNPLQCLLVGAAALGEDTKDFCQSQPNGLLDLKKASDNLLIMAAEYRSNHTLELILNLNKFDINCEDSLRNTPLFLSVFEAFNCDCLPKLKLLIGRGANLDHLNKKNQNLLLYAAKIASFESFNYILSLNRFDIDSVDIKGNTPLFLSVFRGYADCFSKLKLLIEKGAKLDHVNNKKQNLLLYLARHASLESLNYILSLNKFDINCVDLEGRTPLMLSVVAKMNSDCLLKFKALIDKGADLHAGDNLLCFAAKHSISKVLEYLLDTHKFDINSKDKDRLTPLFNSVYQRKQTDCLQKLKLLVSRNANLDFRDKNDLNLLHRVAQVGKVDVLEYVINLSKFDINGEDKFGRTALYYAKMTDANDCLYKFQAEEKVNLLIENGCIDKAELLENEASESSFRTGKSEVSSEEEQLIRIDDNDISNDESNLSLPNKPNCYISRVLKVANCILTEEAFFNIVCSNVDSKAVIINGPTGMGKTTFFAQIGRRILRTFPQRKVFYLKLQEIIDEVKKVNKSDTVETDLIWDALKAMTDECKLEKHSLSLKAPSCSLETTELFLDDLDLVQDNDMDLVCNIIKCISASYPFTHIRLWITTHPKHLEKIDVLRNVESYTIEPLGEPGQVEILTSYLEEHTSKDRNKLIDFARKCVKNYSSGNPLQCLLVGAATVGDKNFIQSNDFSEFEPKNVQLLTCIYKNLLLDAADHMSFHTLKLILNLNKFDINCMDTIGNTPLFLSVYKDDNVDCLLKLKFLIEKGAILDHLNNNNSSLLSYVARYGSLETLDYIISLEKLDINNVDIHGNTPLFKSIYADNNSDCLPKMKLLIDRGANLDHINKDNYNLLLYAAKFATIESFDYILNLNKLDINSVTITGEPPLFVSVIALCNQDCVLKLKRLIDMGANLYQNYNVSTGGNFLCYAAAQGSVEILEYIMDTYKFDINSEDEHGNTTLFLSLYFQKGLDSLKKFKLFQDRGARINHVNKLGWNLIHFAAFCGSFEVLEYVVNLARFDINLCDKLGRTALYYAKNSNVNPELRSDEKESKVKFLIEKGCIDRE